MCGSLSTEDRPVNAYCPFISSESRASDLRRALSRFAVRRLRKLRRENGAEIQAIYKHEIGTLCEVSRLAIMLAFIIWPLRPTRLWGELAGVALLISVTGTAPAQSMLVPVGEARTIKLQTDANTAVIGDIDIADARIAFGDTVVLIGKHQGTSNLIVYDESGREIHNSTIKVVSKSDKNVVALITGSRRTILDCSPALCIERREPDSLSETEVARDGEVSTRTETQRQ